MNSTETQSRHSVQRLVSQPGRIQLSRKKGWRLPPNTVVVSRPHRWGNPFKVGGYAEVPNSRGSTLRLIRDRASAVRWFKAMLRQGKTPPFALANMRSELAGKNLACWCPLGEPCHADVLLRLANEKLTQDARP